MDRENLFILRKEVFTKYKERTALGGFDTNSETICFCLSSIMEILTHLLEEQKRQDVHRKTKSKTD